MTYYTLWNGWLSQKNISSESAPFNLNLHYTATTKAASYLVLPMSVSQARSLSFLPLHPPHPLLRLQIHLNHRNSTGWITKPKPLLMAPPENISAQLLPEIKCPKTQEQKAQRPLEFLWSKWTRRTRTLIGLQEVDATDHTHVVVHHTAVARRRVHLTVLHLQCTTQSSVPCLSSTHSSSVPPERTAPSVNKRASR